MADDARRGTPYWSVIQPIWRAVSVYDGPAVFLEQFAAVRPEVGHLYAVHWYQSEVRNGGHHQFFSNSTGVLAPEALDGVRAIGLPEWAAILGEAMRFFGDPYPRDQLDRIERLMKYAERGDKDADPFAQLDRRLYTWLRAESDRWERVADRYAASV